ncbi:COP9 signalosome catalytic subunit rri1 [Malassezia japonica]|uniref:COP9 signalosome complex subunit 5 n=1 Tax=Malassezia japonica TaxID=223818 RepID=A0AAF0EVP3_9BASI|nr:COP9 signalosome catalytic subunit rri1 [Malassezia japonica]WFD37968.1 COP9 signalosome catalytic subunit rri1 [Malassezia japonica]
MDPRETARATFEVQNEVVTLDAETRAIYAYDAEAYQKLLRDAPWRDDVHYFQKVRISVVALMKMVLHARLGGALEVMGLMQGTVCPDTRTFYILDAFALPVHGTETRVNAQNEAYEYMIQYLDQCSDVRRPQQAVGWYHSHPGYRCWLSGIDVETQQTNQRQDPFVAVVIDPHHTMTAGQVDIGAFRTFPADYHAEGRSTQQAVLPSHKTEEYGAHADRYYSLAVELFTTSAMRPLFHLLWNEYWAHTLCTSPSLLQRTLSIHHTNDLVNQLREATAQLGGGGLVPGGASFTQAARAASRSHDAEPAQDLANELERRAAEQPLARIADEANQQASQARHEALRESLKTALFAPTSVS